MTNLKSIKYRITEAVISELENRSEFNDVDKVLPRWWFTGRQEGLRLTEFGDLHFRLAEIEFYEHSLEHDMKNYPNQEWNSFLLECNRKIKCPYFFGVNKIDGAKIPYIRLYDSKIAMMIKLYGSLREYLNSIKDRR